jgi:hypothetical protein
MPDDAPVVPTGQLLEIRAAIGDFDPLHADDLLKPSAGLDADLAYPVAPSHSDTLS